MSVTLDKILKLGHPKLYEIAAPVTQEELPQLQSDIDLMHDLVLEFRRVYNAGRAIAAPQIGLMKRIICMNTDKRYTFINPVLSNMSEEMMEMWDDCMSFPNLLVRLKRHQSCTMTFRDLEWKEHVWELKDDLSELLQHEYDHLDGILAIDRAIDERSFKWR